MDFKLPPRIQNSNKGTYGKVLNIAGSRYMSGAACLSSLAALRSGCGYVQLLSEDTVLRAVARLAPEVIFAPVEELENVIKTADVLAIGCGMSTSDNAAELFQKAISLSTIPTIIDADGLNILSKLENIKLPETVILTPHPKEASRLLNTTLENVLNNMEESAKEITGKYNCITVLKSHRTIVCSTNNEIYYNTTGNSALAKSGSGDVLTGIISALLAQKMQAYDAACLGVYIHGLTGDIAKNDLTEYGVLASDQIRYIPYAFKSLIKD